LGTSIKDIRRNRRSLLCC